MIKNKINIVDNSTEEINFNSTIKTDLKNKIKEIIPLLIIEPNIEFNNGTVLVSLFKRTDSLKMVMGLSQDITSFIKEVELECVQRGNRYINISKKYENDFIDNNIKNNIINDLHSMMHLLEIREKITIMDILYRRLGRSLCPK